MKQIEEVKRKKKKKNNNEILFSIGLGKICCFHAMIFLD